MSKQQLREVITNLIPILNDNTADEVEDFLAGLLHEYYKSRFPEEARALLRYRMNHTTFVLGLQGAKKDLREPIARELEALIQATSTVLVSSSSGKASALDRIMSEYMTKFKAHVAKTEVMMEQAYNLMDSVIQDHKGATPEELQKLIEERVSNAVSGKANVTFVKDIAPQNI